MAIVHNPLLSGDFPDPCAICVDGVFYMTATSVHSMPGIPILRSYDLAHWEVAAYVYDTFQENDAHTLQNGENIYGKGSWATCLRWHDGWFTVCFNSNDARDTFIYRARDIQGPWSVSRLGGVHYDPTLLFDDDGRTYIIHGNGTLYITELEADATAVKPGGLHQVLIDTPKVDGLNCEGSHMHKIHGWYYLMTIQWPKGRRRLQWCYRCRELTGTYEGRVVLDDDMGYFFNGVAQGGLFEAPDGWYAMLFQDRGAMGRSPVLLPVRWEADWPVLGEGGKAPLCFEVPYADHAVQPFTHSDDFEYAENRLSLCWQWNHNPDNARWSVIERAGWLCLHSTASPCLMQAHNTLTQRTQEPISVFTTQIDTAHMRDGDRAGLAAFQHRFGAIGAMKEDGRTQVMLLLGEGEAETIAFRAPLQQQILHLKVVFDFAGGKDLAHFYFSLDGAQWTRVGDPLSMDFNLKHFMGYRAALFSYATQTQGGYADFAYLRFAQTEA